MPVAALLFIPHACSNLSSGSPSILSTPRRFQARLERIGFSGNLVRRKKPELFDVATVEIPEHALQSFNASLRADPVQRERKEPPLRAREEEVLFAALEELNLGGVYP